MATKAIRYMTSASTKVLTLNGSMKPSRQLNLVNGWEKSGRSRMAMMVKMKWQGEEQTESDSHGDVTLVSHPETP